MQKKRYEEITDDIKERLDFELETIERTGYPGYFLIVQDFCEAARQMGVSVGPGRGSAAGSAVAYCTNITNIDPIKYNLLFERFLNPESEFHFLILILILMTKDVNVLFNMLLINMAQVKLHRLSPTVRWLRNLPSKIVAVYWSCL